MRTSESVAKIAPALLAAQKAITFAAKDSLNPHFKSKYADLPCVIDAVKPALNEAGIVFIQSASPSEPGYLAMTTRLMHQSGEWIEDTATLPLPKADPQGYGSASTYARRYGLAAICGLYQDDDDGNSASQPQKAVMQESAKSIGKADYDSLPAEEKAIANSIASSIIDAFESEDEQTAFSIYSESKTKYAGRIEIQTAIWNLLDSKMRSTIKRIGKAKELVTQP